MGAPAGEPPCPRLPNHLPIPRFSVIGPRRRSPVHEDHHVQRIVKLLRLARDQEGTPEGKTAAKQAVLLQKRHGIQVELEDIEEAMEKSAQLVVEPEPVAWKEYLGETLATIYRCECDPRWTGVSWQLWVHSDEAERVATCLDHFTYLHDQVRNRSRRIRVRQAHLPKPTQENKEQSYAEGLVYEASRALLRRLGWHGEVPFIAEGFDPDEFLAKSRDPLEPPEEHDTGEPGLRRYRYQAPHDPVVEDDATRPPPNEVVDTDVSMFARGRSDVRYLRLIPGRLEDVFR